MFVGAYLPEIILVSTSVYRLGIQGAILLIQNLIIRG